jgi:hypothetical protein
LVANGNSVGQISFNGADGTDFRIAATITGQIDGTPGANDMPGRIVLSTTAPGASAPTTRMTIDSSGRMLVGTSTAHNVGGALGNAQFSGAGTQVHFVSTSTSPSYVNLAAGSSGTDVTGSTTLGRLRFYGYHTNGYDLGAQIEAAVDGTPSDGDLPTRLVFSVTADSAASPTEAMRITSDAYVRLAAGTGGIQFGGDTAAANALDDYEEGTWTPTITRL